MSRIDAGTTSVVAWYREDQWDRLRELSSDRDGMAETYAEWRDTAERNFKDLTDAGASLRRLELDVEDLWAWCRANDRALDGAARSMYAARLARELSEKGELP